MMMVMMMMMMMMIIHMMMMMIIMMIIIIIIIIVIIIIIIIIIIVIIIIIIIIALKGSIRDFFYNLLTAPRTASNTYAEVAWALSCANYVQHIEHLSRATRRVTCHVVRRDSSAVKFDKVEIAFI